jgi:hypothetical protein
MSPWLHACYHLRELEGHLQRFAEDILQFIRLPGDYSFHHCFLPLVYVLLTNTLSLMLMRTLCLSKCH